MWLSGSYKTGEKILKNMTHFSFEFEENHGDLYKFKWSFDSQYGYINISFREGKISNSSLIDTCDGSKHPFQRPLGLYNDDTLYGLFLRLMSSININVIGVYTQF